MRISRNLVVLGAAVSSFLLAGRASADDRVVARRGYALEVAGGVTFAASYLPALSLGLYSTIENTGHRMVCIFPPCRAPRDDGAALLLPVAGPLIYADTTARDDALRKGPPSTAERALLYSTGAIQAAGLAMLLAGVVQSAPPRAARSADVSSPTGRGRITVVPIASPSVVGLGGTF